VFLGAGCRSQKTFQDAKLTEKVWARVKRFLPEKLDGGCAVGLQPTWRAAKYFPGQWVMPHMDFRHCDSAAETVFSRVSCTIYLDDGANAATTFVTGVDNYGNHKAAHYRNVPKAGSAVLFYQGVPEFTHYAERVPGGGTKNIIRADVMYEFPDKETARAEPK